MSDPFRSTFDMAAVGIAHVAPDGRFLRVNRSFCRMTGYGEEEILGTSDREITHPADRDSDLALRRRLLAGGRTESRSGKRYIGKDGEPVDVRVATSVASAGSEEEYFILVVEKDGARPDDAKALLGMDDQLRRMIHHMQSTREKESSRIAQWIHDDLGQALTRLKIDLVWLGRRLHGDQFALLEKTLAMEKDIDRTIEAVQRISRELRPGMLDELGLVDAIEWFTLDFEKRTGVVCNFVAEEPDMELGKEISTAIFRILTEALSNIPRHSDATESDVSLYLNENRIMLEVKDNGRGIAKDAANSPESFGLLQIRQRAAHLDGTVRIEGIPDVGTIITVSIPFPPEKGNACDSNPDH